ncbi:coniferyl aldehyde dehydrogenase [Niveibacterium umoris]|uniref:Aldehyde dehydrogenase n=1 Tax=Niveibacterium umoris TaxID=1193620 RepID=A0A840BLN1_9RHOO|nr:coniferyl aldehyde dehydrogenase [Niveibacterium umoris]MBB4014471.1 acyl-CoA reductase-like NAD-dependent aldehyde dehydrogenase [Niveibacterium umoris]
MKPTDLPQSGLSSTFAAQRAAFGREPMPDAAARRANLDRLARLLKDNQQAICDAISADFGHRSSTETRLIEIFPSLEAIRYARSKVAGWMKPARRHTGLWFLPGRSQVRYQPLGVVGVIVPWNYPLYLAVGPLVGALAAGNRVLVKMSEYGPAFGELFARLIAEAFPPDLVSVVLGGADVAAEFSSLPFDHLLFTGSTPVGRIVMAAAAKNLTPVTLELGGKSPAIVAPGVDIKTAAQRIGFGKMMNCGQTCIAPDYVLLPRGQEEAFIAAMRAFAAKLYGDAASPDLASLAHERQFARMQALLDEARAMGARVEPLLPDGALSGRKMAPVVLLGGTPAMRVMQEEIFGPILPIIPYDTLDDAIAYVNAHDRPLALYVFDDQRRRIESLLDRTASGGVTVNDCILHIAQDDIPFGGVGPSGMGRYHGPEGFKTFSQQRAVFRQAALNGSAILHPPFGKPLAEKLIRLMLR